MVVHKPRRTVRKWLLCTTCDDLAEWIWTRGRRRKAFCEPCAIEYLKTGKVKPGEMDRVNEPPADGSSV